MSKYLDIFALSHKCDSQSTSVSSTGPYSHEDAGVCPVCKKQMVAAFCQKEQVWFCVDHRIAMPQAE